MILINKIILNQHAFKLYNTDDTAVMTQLIPVNSIAQSSPSPSLCVLFNFWFFWQFYNFISSCTNVSLLLFNVITANFATAIDNWIRIP